MDLDAIIDAAGARPVKRQWPAALVERGKPLVEALRKFKEARADAVLDRFDSWVNNVTGHGTSRDKATYGLILPDRLLTDPELSALYHHDDMAGRMVDIVPQEMLREGFFVDTGEPGLNEVLKEKHRVLETRQNLLDGQRWGRCFGGGATLIGCDDGLPMEEPLRPERAEDVDFLLTFDRRYVWPLTYYKGVGPKMGKVETYLVTSVDAAGYLALSTAVVHESRLLLHRGMPTAAREKLQLASWDLSIYQRAYLALRQFNTGWSSTEQLMADGSQAVYTIGGLQAIIAAGGEDMLRERLKAMDMFRSVVQGIVLDADAKETFERKSASLEGWYQTLQAQMLRIASAVEVPVTILMGQSPAGMNATGESDFRWFYDRLKSQQTNVLAPMIEGLTAVWLRTKAGARALAEATKRTTRAIATITAKFPDLWRETPKDRAARELSIAQRDSVYVQAQVFSPDQVALVRGREGGFDQEIILSKEEAKALEERQRQSLGLPETDDAAPPGDGEEEDVPAIQLSQEDVEAIITVNEARAQLAEQNGIDLPPLPDERGEMTLAEIKKGAKSPAPETPPEPDPEPDPGDPGEGGEPADEEPPIDEQGRMDAMPAGMRTFTLQRDKDVNGHSGEGDVAHGCLFPDGKVAMRWNTATSTTVIFDDMSHVERIHGHDGATWVRWHDQERVDSLADLAGKKGGK